MLTTLSASLLLHDIQSVMSGVRLWRRQHKFQVKLGVVKGFHLLLESEPASFKVMFKMKLPVFKIEEVFAYKFKARQQNT